MQSYLKLVIVLGLISSCSTLNFWSDDQEEDITKPAELQPFENEHEISVVWKKSFKGSNDLGSFKPSFYLGQMFFADSEGNIVSLDSKNLNLINLDILHTLMNLLGLLI